MESQKKREGERESERKREGRETEQEWELKKTQKQREAKNRIFFGVVFAVKPCRNTVDSFAELHQIQRFLKDALLHWSNILW